MSVDEVMSDLHQPWQEHPKLATNLQPTCNQLETDCISRQAAIDAVESLPNCPNGFSDTYDKACIIGVLEELPSVQPDIARDIVTILENEQDMRVVLQNERKRGRWIPCSERLPEKDGRYLITGKMGTVYSLDFEDGRWYGGIKPIAWRELPEPWRGGQDETN